MITKEDIKDYEKIHGILDVFLNKRNLKDSHAIKCIHDIIALADVCGSKMNFEISEKNHYICSDRVDEYIKYCLAENKINPVKPKADTLSKLCQIYDGLDENWEYVHIVAIAVKYNGKLHPVHEGIITDEIIRYLRNAPRGYTDEEIFRVVDLLVENGILDKPNRECRSDH